MFVGLIYMTIFTVVNFKLIQLPESEYLISHEEYLKTP